MKARIKHAFYIGITALLLGACSDDNKPNPNDNRADATTPSITIQEDFDCFFTTKEPGCLTFDIKDKDKIIQFFESPTANNNEALNTTNKPNESSVFDTTPITLFWSDPNTGAVVYEISYNMAIMLIGEPSEKLHYIELTDYQRNQKLFLNNTDDTSTRR